MSEPFLIEQPTATNQCHFRQIEELWCRVTPNCVNQRFVQSKDLPRCAPKVTTVKAVTDTVVEQWVENKAREMAWRRKVIEKQLILEAEQEDWEINEADEVIEYSRPTDDELTDEDRALIDERMKAAYAHGIHPTAEYTPAQYWELAERAYERGYRTSSREMMCA